MGYSKSKRAIRRVETYLQQLVAAESKIDFPGEDTAKLAYYIREGITASRAFTSEGEPYISYARLNAKFVVRVKGSVVSCEPRDEVNIPAGLGHVSIPDVSDTLGIIGATIKHKASLIIFPDATIHSVDMTRLTSWGEKNGYLVIADDERVVLEKT